MIWTTESRIISSVDRHDPADPDRRPESERTAMARSNVPEDPMVRALVAASRRARGSAVSRRTFLTGVLGAAGAGAVLSACGTGGSKPSGTGGGASGPLRWANWTLYLDQSEDGQSYPTLEAFIEKTGIDVTYSEDVEDNDSFYGKVKGQLANGQDIGYDIVTLTDWMAARWIREGYTTEWKRADMPNTANLLPELEDVDFDPGRTHSLTWQSGFAGLAWDTTKVPAGMTSVEDLWDPSLKGRIEVLSEMRDTIGLIMLSQGVDPSGDWGDDEFGNALDVLKEQIASGQIRQVRGNSYAQDLVSGDAIAVIGWSGDIMALNLENEDRFGFAIPDAGGTLWSDNLMVPSTSGRLTDAEKLIDFYYDPEIAAQVAAWVNYITPVQGAQEAMKDIDPDLVDNELIFPSDETLEKVKVFRTLTPEEEDSYNGQFLEAIGA
jgi:spermidine/putrescine transport system substrate-binding protein